MIDIDEPAAESRTATATRGAARAAAPSCQAQDRQQDHRRQGPNRQEEREALPRRREVRGIRLPGQAGESRERREAASRPWATLRYLLLLIASFAAFAWRIDRPVPWIDEAATWQAVQRPWGRLLAMLGGADAPLVPYYAVGKVWTAAGGQVTGLRLLSAAAAAAATTCLAVLVARWAGWWTGLTAAALLVGLAGFDRYAQEARPYGLLALLTCASWIVWDVWRRSRSTAAGLLLAAVTAALGVTHLFGLLVLPAQVLADRGSRDTGSRDTGSPDTADPGTTDPGTTDPGTASPRRIRWNRWWPDWRQARRTAAWGFLGVLVADVQIGIAVVNGSGPTTPLPATPSNLWGTEVISLSSAREALVPVAVILGLAAIGAAMLRRPRWRGAVVPLLSWALVPLMLAAAGTVVQPNLLRARYWIGMLPPVAGLAAIGVVATAGAAGRALQRAFRCRPGAAAAATAASALVLVALNTGVEAPLQEAIRERAGHGEDAVTAMHAASAAARRDGGKITVSPPQGALVMSVAEAGAPVVRLFAVDPGRADIWPVERPASAVAADLVGVRTVHLLYREPGGTVIARPVEHLPPADQVRGDVPQALAQLGFRVVDAAEVSPGWILADLARAPSPAVVRAVLRPVQPRHRPAASRVTARGDRRAARRAPVTTRVSR